MLVKSVPEVADASDAEPSQFVAIGDASSARATASRRCSMTTSEWSELHRSPSRSSSVIPERAAVDSAYPSRVREFSTVQPM